MGKSEQVSKQSHVVDSFVVDVVGCVQPHYGCGQGPDPKRTGLQWCYWLRFWDIVIEAFCKVESEEILHGVEEGSGGYDNLPNRKISVALRNEVSHVSP